MKKIVFRFLSILNKKVLPSYIHKDLALLSQWDKILLGYRIWVTKNYLDLKQKN